MTSQDKVNKRIFTRFRLSLIFLGLSTTTVYLHKYLVNNYPVTSRSLYMDKIFDKNEFNLHKKIVK
jgi:hypothetical protein